MSSMLWVQIADANMNPLLQSFKPRFSDLQLTAKYVAHVI